MRRKQKGFTLVEIAVGMAVGLLATLAIFQTLAMFEKQRRTTEGAGDAQENGLVALYTLEQDFREGGLGLIDYSVLPCARINAFSPSSVQSSAPVLIQSGAAAGAPDTLFTNRLDSDTGGLATGGQRAHLLTSSQTVLTVDTGKGLKLNDYLLLSDPVGNIDDCSLLQVTSANSQATLLTGASPVTVQVQAVANPAGDTGQSPTFPVYTGTAMLNDLGQGVPKFVSSKYYVDDNVSPHTGTFNLMQSDNNGTSQAIASNIVNIQAQYGVSPGPNQPINCWTEASSGGASCAPGNWTPAGISRANIARIKAVRVAVVVRSNNLESTKDSSGVCSTTTTAPVSWPTSSFTGSDPPPVIDLSSNPNWRCYRYKVYQTIIPLKNAIWQKI